MQRQMEIRKSVRRGGFTLLEVLLVLLIIGVIAAIAVPNLMGRQQEANIRAAKATIHSVEQTIKMYAVNNSGEFPSGSRDEVFTMLMDPGEDSSGKQIAPYRDSLPRDPWNEVLYYEHPSSKVSSGLKPAIWSSGPNRQNEDGSGDDVNNWDTVGR